MKRVQVVAQSYGMGRAVVDRAQKRLDQVRAELEEGGRYSFSDAAVADVPRSHGVYAIFQGNSLLYVGDSSRPTGTLQHRMRVHLVGPTGATGPGDQFRNYLCRYRSLTPSNLSEKIHRLPPYRPVVDRYVRHYCTFSFVPIEPGKAARVLEGLLIPLMKPEFNKWPGKTSGPTH